MTRILTSALVVLLALAACERREQPREAEQPVPPAATPEPAPAPPSAVFPGDVIEQNLGGARDDLAKGNRDAASEKLRDAAARLTSFAENATADARRDLLSAASEIQKIAADVKSGAIADASALDHELARVSVSLAEYHLTSAREALTRRDTRALERDLAAAADHLESGGRRAGRAVGSATTKAIDDVRDAAKKLTEDAETIPGDIERILNDLGREIEQLKNDTHSPGR